MKFATVALLLATSVQAIRVTQTTTSALAKGPSEAAIQEAKEILAKCDKNKSGSIDWKEAQDCGVPATEKHMFDKLAGKNGVVDRHELLAIVEHDHENKLAQKGPSAAAIAEAKEILAKCDTDKSNSISWKEAQACGVPATEKKMFDKLAGKNGVVDDHELLAIVEHDHENKLAQEGPHSAADIIAECDKDGDKQLTDDEMKKCIDAQKDLDWEERKELKSDVRRMFHKYAGKDGKMSGRDLRKAMKGEKVALAQQGPDNSNDIIEACDLNEDGKISKKEMEACIDKHVPANFRAQEKERLNKEWAKIDTNKDGEVSRKEMKAVMEEE